MKRRVAIVGGGASGVIAAIHLLTEFGSDVEILLFEPRERLGEGLAYSTPSHSLILNVPVDKMSATKDPHHFKDWCTKYHPALNQSADYPFVPRALFADYLNSTLLELQSEKRHPILHLREKVKAIRPSRNSWIVQTASGEQKVDNVFVATGYHPQLVTPANLKNQAVMQPYDFEQLKKIRSGDSLLIIGAGLAAIDCWRFLRSEGYTGKIAFASRRAHFPIEHALGAKPAALPKLAGSSPRKIFALVRRLQSEGEASFVQLADGLRMQAAEIWNSWSTKEKQQFLRHAKPYWELIRHRVPKTVSDALNSELHSGKITLVRIGAVQPSTFQHLILATGYGVEQQSLKVESVPLCDLGFGWSHARTQGLWFLGPSIKSVYWEITSVPDIRTQVIGIVDKMKSRTFWQDLRRFVGKVSFIRLPFEHKKAS